MSVLLAALIALGILNRNRELIALKAVGIRATYYTRPIVLAALVLSLVHLAMGETVARSASRKSQQIWQEYVMQRKSSVSLGQENVWFRGKEVIYQIRFYDPKNKTMEKTSLFYLDSQFKLTQRLDAKRIRWNDNRWVAEDGLTLNFKGADTQQEWFDQKKLDLNETPEDFVGLESIPEELDFLSLYRYVHRIRKDGFTATPYEVELQLRLAFPLTTFILSLLGITIALRQGIHGGIAVGAGMAVLVASIYLAVLQTGCALATAGILPPMVGVWAGNIIFLMLVAYLWITDVECQ
jgi:lipopolysaccharide export system permease protein